MDSSRFKSKSDYHVQLFYDMKEHIRCSRCKRLPRPKDKIYRCVCGKTACAKCGVCCKGERCGRRKWVVGRKAYYECDGFLPFPKPTPDPLLNQLLATQLPFECKNTRFGCKQILMPDELFQHEDNCLDQPINCADLTCQETVGFLSYLDHFEARHAGQMTAAGNGRAPNTFVITRGDPRKNKEFKVSRPVRMTAYGRDFFEVGHIRNGLFYRWIYAHVTSDEAKHFQFQSVLRTAHGNEIAFTGMVHPLINRAEDIVKCEEDVFVIRLETYAKMINKDGNVNFTITLRNLKDEAKDDDQESGISDDE